ncbi:zinc finger MYM-type protein 1-like [Sergentomyia squamirostris]
MQEQIFGENLNANYIPVDGQNDDVPVLNYGRGVNVMGNEPPTEAAEVATAAAAAGDDVLNRRGAEKDNNFKNDIGLWKTPLPKNAVNFWIHKDETDDLRNCDQVTFNKYSQKQQRTDRDSSRICTLSLFSKDLPSNEKIPREWLCFSPETGKIYCFYCKLFSTCSQSHLANIGVKNWQNAPAKLKSHEESKEHKEASITFRTRRKEGTSVCRSLEKQAKDTKIYNIEVLKRVVEVIKYLGERGYAFHGDDAIIGSPHNGNFLGIIELISKFDPFLAEHLAKHANKGRGHVNYLSKTIVEQLIKIMAKRVRKEIVSRIKRAKYFSISVDSSPDESHVDQLAVTAKYLEGACSVERFLTFIPHCGHKGNDMAEALLTFCEQEKINFADCRGQSYDNASNMSGKYKGMQAILKDKNPYAVFIPCAAHSLNLVVKAAAKIDLANTLFNLLQAVYNFFTNSTSRCDRLKVAFKTGEKEDHHDRLFPKNLSVTRWSARFDATKAIISGFAEIVKTLQAISEDMVDEKDITRKEASGLHHQLLKWENCVFLVFWSDILEKIHIVNKNLQGTNITLSSMLKQLRGLTEVIKSKRDKFSDYVELANKFTSEKPVEGRSRKPNVRNLPLDYGRAPAVSLDKTDTLRINGFIPVIEQVTSSLERRTSVYIDVADRFKLFSSLDHTEKEIEVMAAKLVESYPKDLEPGLKGELEMLFGMVKSMPKPEAVSTEMFLYQEVLELRSTFITSKWLCEFTFR